MIYISYVIFARYMILSIKQEFFLFSVSAGALDKKVSA